jgi:hypothetical protein
MLRSSSVTLSAAENGKTAVAAPDSQSVAISSDLRILSETSLMYPVEDLDYRGSISDVAHWPSDKT